MAYFQNKPRQLPRTDPQDQEPDQESDSSQGFTVEELMSTPEGKQAYLESQISAQARENKRTQEWNAKLAEPLVPPPPYVPGAVWGGAKAAAGTLTKIGGAFAKLGDLPGVGMLPRSQTLTPDPFKDVATAGRYGKGEPLSLFGVEGNEYMFGPSGGSESTEAAGAEIEKFGEMSLPGGPIKKGAAMAPTYLRSPMRSFLEAVNAYTQAKMHGDDPETAAGLAALFPAFGQIFAKGTHTVAPGISTSLGKQGRSYYGGIFGPSGKREKAIARRAVEPLIESRKTYPGGFSMPEGVFLTRGQVGRFAQNKIDVSKAQKKAEIARLPGGENFEMSYDDFEAGIRQTIKDELMETSAYTGASEFKGDAAREAARHLEGMLTRARNISRPIGGQRMIPYKNLMGFKEEAQDALAEAGAYAEKRGGRLTPELRGQRHFAGEAQEATAREAPEVWNLDQEISKFANVTQGIMVEEGKHFGRTRGVGAPVISAVGGQGAIERGLTYGKWDFIIRTWERIKGSPALRTGIGKGIMINTANALKRGDFDGAASGLGRLAARILPESELDRPVGEKEQFRVFDEYDYDPNSGGFIPRVGGPRKEREPYDFNPPEPGKPDKFPFPGTGGDRFVDIEGKTHTYRKGKWERER